MGHPAGLVGAGGGGPTKGVTGKHRVINGNGNLTEPSKFFLTETNGNGSLKHFHNINGN